MIRALVVDALWVLVALCMTFANVCAVIGFGNGPAASLCFLIGSLFGLTTAGLIAAIRRLLRP